MRLRVHRCSQGLSARDGVFLGSHSDLQDIVGMRHVSESDDLTPSSEDEY
jgi:hypothetical protein